MDFEYSLTALNGKRLAPGGRTHHTEIVVPQLIYPNSSYQVQITPPGLFTWRVSAKQSNVIEILPEEGTTSSQLKATESVKVVIAHANAIL